MKPPRIQPWGDCGKYRSLILGKSSTEEKLEVIAGTGAGRTMLVTGCSPGLNMADRGRLISVAHDNSWITVSVKQSLAWWLAVDRKPDFHVTSNFARPLNSCQCNMDTIRVHLLHFDQNPPANTIVDIPLRIKQRGETAYQDVCISNTRQFDDWLLEKTPIREYGPTIVPTVVFYLAVHLKVRQVLTVGVDFTGIGHFDAPAKLGSAGLAGSLEEQSWFINSAGHWLGWMLSHGVDWKRVKVDYATNLSMIPEVNV